jgi:hypothetical protein
MSFNNNTDAFDIEGHIETFSRTMTFSASKDDNSRYQRSKPLDFNNEFCFNDDMMMVGNLDTNFRLPLSRTVEPMRLQKDQPEFDCGSQIDFH